MITPLEKKFERNRTLGSKVMSHKVMYAAFSGRNAKVLQLACYSVKLILNSIFKGGETIKASILIKFCRLKAICTIFLCLD